MTHYQYRWRLLATLTTTSSMHVGDGGTRTVPLADKKVRVSTIHVDHRGKPWIPGSSIKGVLLALARKRGMEAGLLKALFGSSAAEAGSAGLARWMGATWTQPPTFSDGCAPAWYDAGRGTAIDFGNRIDRDKGTTLDRHLFHLDYVPPGTRFEWEVVVEHHDLAQGKELVRWARALMASFDGAFASPGLGADAKLGWGRCCLSGLEVHHFGPEEMAAWIQGIGAQTWQQAATCCTQNPDLVASPWSVDKSASSTELTLNVRIAMQELYLSNDPSHVTTQRQDGVAQAHVARRDGKGKPVLSERSLHHRLRAQAERILRTLHVPCCAAGGVEPCGPVVRLDPEGMPLHRRNESDQPVCLACQMFGAVGWQGRVGLSGWHAADPGSAHEQDFIARDRLTGGVYRKYNAIGCWKPVFEGRLHWPRNWSDAAQGLWLLTLRDLAEGDVDLGWGTRKGYGECRATARNEEGNAEPLVNAALAALSALADPSGNVLLQALRALRPEASADVAPPPAPPNPLPQDTSSPGPVGGNPVGPQAFHPPHHFLPIERAATTLTVDDFQTPEKWNGADGPAKDHSHGAYGAGLFSGTLRCSVWIEQPTFVGGRRTPAACAPGKKAAATQSHYQVPQPPSEEGSNSNANAGATLAIPATTLKGLIGSLAEACSGSALRVLDTERIMSYRKGMTQALSALGRVSIMRGKKTGETRFVLEPLCLPVTPYQNEQIRMPQNPGFATVFGADNVARFAKAYVGQLCADPEGLAKDKAGVIVPTLRSNLPGPVPSPQTDWRYVQLNERPPHLTAAGGQFLGWRLDLKAPILDHAAWRELAPNVRVTYTCGVIRALDLVGRIPYDDVPNNKKHEIFVPVPLANTPGPIPEKLHIPPHVVERYHALAKERFEATDGQYPLLPLGARTSYPKDPWRLRSGDLIYFDVDQKGTEVTELSHSMIWRARVENPDHSAATVADFLTGPPSARRADRVELLPFHPSRKTVTPVEMLLGFVQDGTDAAGRQAPAFAGKLRFSTALPINGASDDERPLRGGVPVTLKILASPKYGSGYLRPRNTRSGGYIAKRDANPETHELAGRLKMAVHHRPPKGNQPPWASAAPNDHVEQKVIVHPLTQGRFHWHVRFDNLSKDELALLCFCLRPDDAFRHRLGLGQPLGLGQVRIEVDAVELVDRVKRYGADPLNAPRSHTNLENAQGEKYDAAASDWQRAWAAAYAGNNRFTKTKRALRLLGDPARVVAPTHYPAIVGQDAPPETDGFEWFVANNDPLQNNGQQFLTPLDAAKDGCMPTLQKLFTQQKPHKQRK